MANKKITELTELIAAGDNDLIPIVDLVAVETKKIKVTGLKASLNLQRSDVGLGNVDNTADINKPISSSTQSALNTKANSSDVYTKTESDSNFEPKNSNIQTHISNTSNPHNVTKSQVGLGNVPNIDATSRSNHTGTQLSSTISDFKDSVNSTLTEGNNVELTYNGSTVTIASKYRSCRDRGIFGPVSLGSNNILPIIIPSIGSITNIKAFSKIAPTGSDLIIDILKNGTTIFTSTADRLTIIDSNQNSTIGAYQNSLSVNDILEIEITQIGSINSGETLTIVIEIEHG